MGRAHEVRKVAMAKQQPKKLNYTHVMVKKFI